MKPKDKAKELLEKYIISTWIKNDEIKLLTTVPDAKTNAMIAVDEIISNMPYGFYSGIRNVNDLDFWKDVKTELEKL